MASGRRLILTVSFLSAAVLGFEVSLMRILLVASWHHFAFLVISIVLLGFGAGGTLLYLARPWFIARADRAVFVLTIACAAAMPLAVSIAQHVPVESRFVPALFWRQVAAWVVYWAVLTVPFMLGATAIGLALMVAGRRLGAVYGANLIGSGVGALAAPALMAVVEPAWLPAWWSATAGVAGLVAATSRRRLAGGLLVAAAVALWLGLIPPTLRIDVSKRSADMKRLLRQGDVSLVGRRVGARAVVEAYRGPVLHDLPFLGLGVAPPPVSVLLADGHGVGSVLEVDGPVAAAVMDRTLPGFACALLPPGSRVALLGETGGGNVWLAHRAGAATIDVVQPDRNLVELVRGPLADLGGVVLDLPGVSVRLVEPRHFLENMTQRFDLIQLSGLAGFAAGSGGIGGLAQDHLATVEGIGAGLDRLDTGGLLVFTRGIQDPPRDNIKLLATVVEALRRRGSDPLRHIVVVRDFLAVCIVVSSTPWEAQRIERVRALLAERELTPVWFSGIERHELNRPDALAPNPSGGDRYHDALLELCSPRAEAFVNGYAFDVRPPTDDRPFFFDFCRVRSLGALRRAYGDLWLARIEIAFAFVLAALVAVGIVGAMATVVPLALVRRGSLRGGRSAALGYFAALGAGYLLIEMVFLSRLTFLFGDPVRAAAVTIAGFLLFSGLGSIATQRIGQNTRVVRTAIGVLIALAVLGTLGLGAWAANLPGPGRLAVCLAAVGPLAFAMGMPMPIGLTRLDRAAPELVPWAWATNGFASVVAPPLALALAMTWGYQAAAVAALVLYASAALLFSALPASRIAPQA